MTQAEPDADSVVLVDESDNALGSLDRAQAHQPPGTLHRAISVCLLDDQGRLLVQQRALNKACFAGLWSNSFCTHPRPGEENEEAARRRVAEELGSDCGGLTCRGSFVYRAVDPVSGLVEHELDHVFVASITGAPRVDPSEVMDWDVLDRWSPADLGDRTWSPWFAGVLKVAFGGSS